VLPRVDGTRHCRWCAILLHNTSFEFKNNKKKNHFYSSERFRFMDGMSHIRKSENGFRFHDRSDYLCLKTRMDICPCVTRYIGRAYEIVPYPALKNNRATISNSPCNNVHEPIREKETESSCVRTDGRGRFFVTICSPA